MGMLKEFRDFAVKGNVMDMAIGIIIGGAFTPIVKSLVGDVIMPPIGYLLGKVDFSKLKLELLAPGADGKGGVVVSYGNFINTVIAFTITAFAVFLLVKAMNAAKRKEEEAPAAPAAPPAEEVLLTEIRDLLKK